MTLREPTVLAWYWRSDRYDPADGRYGGTYIGPAHEDIDAVRAYLERFYGVKVTELRCLTEREAVVSS